jgi:hypothetical protein
MNDHDLDALASDVLDGLLPAEQAADVLRDPEVAQRVAEMRAAQALVRDVPGVDPARREAGLAAALAAADASEAPATSDELAARRSRPHPTGRPRRVPGWLTAAAVLLLVVAFGGLVATVGGRDGGDETSSDAAAPTGQESTDEDASAGGDGSTADSAETADSGAARAESSREASDAAPTTTASASGGQFDDGAATSGGSPVDLGEVGSVDEVAANVADLGLLAAAPPAAEQLPEARTGDDEVLARFAACRPEGAEDEPGRTVAVAAVATLDGRPVAAWVVAEADTRTVIVADAGCTVVGRRTLPG